MKYLVSFLLLLSSLAHAEIREARTMAEALATVSTGDVVVLDIDNTLLEPVQTLGSDQWVDYMIDRNKKAGMEMDKAVASALADWERVQRVTEMELVESSTPRLVNKLKQDGITVLALTARPQSLAATTANQLYANGIELPEYKGFSSNEVTYFNGILFANGKNKGLVLQDFLAQLHITPAHLIFVDDKVKNVKNMDDAFAKAAFPNVNFRYGAADPRVKRFSKEVVEWEWSYFDRTGLVLSDEEAEEQLGE